MTVFFHPSAERELLAARRWYEQRATTLGEIFVSGIERAVAAILANPEAGRLWPGVAGRHAVRRRLVGRFPYAVVYVVVGVDVFVVAVANLHRRPGYWIRRVRRRPKSHTRD